jgi:two-component system, NarL family, sensor kinase
MLLLLSIIKAQSKLSDSLLTLLNSRPMHDTLKTKLFGDLSWELIGSDIRLSQHYAEKELELAHITHRKEDIAQAESDLGNIFNRQAIYDTALIHYNTALKMRSELKQDEKVAGVYANIATVYMRQNKFKESIEINFKVLQLFEVLGNKSKQAIVLGNIGNLYRELKQIRTAEQFYYKSSVLAKEENLPAIEGRALLNIGSMKLEMFDNDTTQTVHLDSSLYFFELSKKVLNSLNDSYNIAALNNNLGHVYLRKKQNEKAIFYFSKALELREKLGDRLGIAISSKALGELFFIEGNLSKSVKYFEKSAEIFYTLENYLELKQTYFKLSRVYEDKKDFASSLKFHQLYSQYNDSVYNSENVNQMAEMNAKYETNKKDLEISKNKTELKLKAEETKQKNTIIISVLLLLVLLSISGVLFIRKKQLEHQSKLNNELATQKEIRSKAIIEAEEKERVRIAKDLHDGIGQLLSAAKLNLSSIESKLNLNQPEQHSAFKNAVNLLDESVKEVRTISHNMMPHTLLKLGLVSAIREFVTKIQNVPNLKVNLEIVGMTERLEAEKESILYRVIQEVISNIIKHSKASELGLQLVRHDKELSIVIEDNGVGFDAIKINTFEGIGLKNIISRVEFINGTVHFDSQPGKGTTVLIDIPV